MIKRLAFVFLLIPSLAISADYTYVQNNFTAGELSPKIYQSRSDLEKYYTGTETLLNMVPLPQGGVVRRPGFEYIAAANTTTGGIRLVPFVFSRDQSYIIELTDGSVRFFSDGAVIGSTGGEDSLIVHFDGDNGSTTFEDSGHTGHTITTEGDTRVVSGIKAVGNGSGYFDGTGDYLSLSDHADFNLSGDFTIEAWQRYQNAPISIGGHAIYFQKTDANNWVSLYISSTDADLDYALYFAVEAAGSTVVLLHSDEDNYIQGWKHVAVTRDGNDYKLFIDGELVDSTTDPDGPANYTGDVTIGYAAEVGSWNGYIDELRVLNGTAAYTANFAPPVYPFSGTDAVYSETTSIGEDDLSVLQWAQSYDTLYMVDGNESPRKLVRSGNADWAESAVSLTASPWGAGNYPKTVTFFQDRLFYGGSDQYPFRVWASQLASYDDLTTGTDDDDGFVINVLATKSEEIKWLSAAQEFIIGTESSLWQMTPGQFESEITPGNVGLRKVYLNGTHDCIPALAQDTMIMINQGGKRTSAIERSEYAYSTAYFKSHDLSILSDHLTEDSKIKEIAYQQNPNNIVWMLLEDGTLLSLTFAKEHEVVGWARHTTDGDIKSIAVIPGGDGNDELWAAIRRTIDDATYTYIERLGKFDFGSDIADATYLDSYLKYEGGAAENISGLSHLEAESVLAYRDYGYVTKTVSSGAINVDPPDTVGYTTEKAVIGLAYNSDFKSVSPVSNDTQKRITPLTTKRITSLSAYVRKSYGADYGANSSNLYDFITGTTTSAGENGIITDKSVTASWSRHPTIFIRAPGPYPLNLDSIMLEMEIGD